MRSLISAVWELLLPVPMPFRFVIIVGGGLWLVYRLFRFLLPFALWPEYRLTTMLRHGGHRPFFGTYSYGNIIIFLLRNLRRLGWLSFLALVLITGGWFVYPAIGETQVATYIARVYEWWNVAEQWAVPKSSPDLLPTALPLTESVVVPTATVTASPASSPLTPSAPPPPPNTTNDTPLVPSEAATEIPTTIHVVQQGESLSMIASFYNVDIVEIVELNKETYPSLDDNIRLIEIGWELKIPGE